MFLATHDSRYESHHPGKVAGFSPCGISVAHQSQLVTVTSEDAVENHPAVGALRKYDTAPAKSIGGKRSEQHTVATIMQEGVHAMPPYKESHRVPFTYEPGRFGQQMIIGDATTMSGRAVFLYLLHRCCIIGHKDSQSAW